MLKTKRVFYWPLTKTIVIEEVKKPEHKEFVKIIVKEENLE
jgi:hypothetical protein